MANISTRNLKLLDTIKLYEFPGTHKDSKANSWIWDVKQSIDSWSRLSIDPQNQTQVQSRNKNPNLTMDLEKPPPFQTFTKQQENPPNKNRTFTSNLFKYQRSRENQSELAFGQNPDEKIFDLRVSEDLEVELLSKQEMWYYKACK